MIVIRTLGRPRGRRAARRRRARRVRSLEPPPAPTTRVTVARADPLGSASEADTWLARLRRDREQLEHEVERATLALNRLVRAHRAAAADPYAREVTPERALAVRVGHGTGEQVADGRFQSAYSLPRPGKRRRRAERLAPQERLAAIVGGREEMLAAEELVLRARADLDADRPREAALQARIALECVLEQLPSDRLGELRRDLERDRDGVAEAATAALAGEPPRSLNRRVRDSVSRMEVAIRRHVAGSP